MRRPVAIRHAVQTVFRRAQETIARTKALRYEMFARALAFEARRHALRMAAIDVDIQRLKLAAERRKLEDAQDCARVTAQVRAEVARALSAAQ